ncbi:UDP-N-acetylmuramoyl-tripeptide--D-alanyl-D-alanine ligase [Flavobacterium psychrophilum]|uniref:UDP-N-acetylmuramoyl-tripeptide--D-alanyl-D- alanine ligase n=1 Tax=Flavobacterium psychrophilum TaxID=96345 RepID=UPI000B7C2579|nr:UDP-N-acetylmuramoyl-tripeptide--D-alanyl-D-alanine ligase [Flavobacterium psychrophilum]MCB6061346.1 UDP-N-acetylmuramoyl-tripeptide--D-alanyl-D-alanine ligase [Flavobacterium psychrophilum]SNB02366.1 UDP-N-acetylmuramoyl-tripeptide--D-alanyl-D-alanine ligase [Flavobacterium psychrophilum]SNB05147.1 UDP-N-acetylmuramoyl-tripeptide--D-alanyl-D-alanine ligase [Flavobacterium psychrophilum]SNB43023.1 UDP-N-acetylmuramoyl-tripeptide--D-alanyl-D-alanine ligase [Flavobacterium psychrophilum]
MKIEEIYQCYLQCTSVSTDTRKIENNSLFIALKGDNFDANTFAEEAISKGALFVIIDDKKHHTNKDKMILVLDSLQTLQELAKYHRQQLGLAIIALTGSNGKTTTKELINVVLSKKYNAKATIGNLNNHIGVPLTLLSFDEDTDIGIVEMGANHQKEIELLCSIAEPNFGYITNFGKAHLEGFGGIDGVIKAKSELYNYLEENKQTAFVNLDDEIQNQKTMQIMRYSFSIAKESDVKIDFVVANPMVEINYKKMKIKSHLIGLYNANNISAAIAIGKYFNIADDDIKDAIQNYIPTNNRSQLIEKNSNNIILDAYNANPSSMEAAITNFIQLKAKDKIAILGDMFELGNDSLIEHKKIIELFINGPEIETYFIGKDFYCNKIEMKNIHFFDTYESFSKSFKTRKTSKNTILIKGSRGMSLERTLEIL